MAEPIFALEHISFTYPGGRQVFRDMDFALYPDRKIGLYGPNGSGKTTFFRLIMGLAAPQEGRILFHGRPLETEKDFRELRCKVGLVLQHAEDQLFCPTVLEDVAFGPLNLGCTQDEARDRAASTLERLGLAGFENRLTHRLSGGEKKLVSLATVLVMEPEALLLDEPTNGLDPAGIQEMRSLIAAMPESTGATVLISSHLLGEMEQMVSQVGILNHGKLLFEGPLAALQRHARGGVLLRVLDAQRAVAVLQAQGIRAVTRPVQPDTLELPPMPDEALAALVGALAGSGAGVVGLTSQTKNLEEIFLSLTKGDGEVA